MSKLDLILEFSADYDAYEHKDEAKEEIKDLMLDLMAETVDGNDMELAWQNLKQKVNEL